jgi:uncharacterized FlaG/YvyC family protein
MTITPVGGVAALPPAAAADHPPRTVGGEATQQEVSPNGSSGAAGSPQRNQDLEELQSLLSRNQLEVRLHVLPDSGVTIMRIVDPQSGAVVREFPNEALARVLADLRARAAGRLDHQA